MMRTRFTVTTIRSTAAALVGLLAAACSSDGGNATATEGNGSSETGTASATDTDTASASNSNSNSASVTDTTPTTEGTATDPDSSSTDPTVADSSSSGGDGCTPEDACIEDTDCAPGQTCIGCLCLGEPTGCAQWGEGAYGDCIAEGNAACMADGGGCLTAAEDIGVCFFSGCETPCDCPQPPKGFEDQVACESISAGDEILDCFIECGPEECPEGMFCVQGTICMFGEAPMGLPDYGDCVNVEGQCDSGVCLSNNPMAPEWGFCSPNCTEDADCAVPETGDAAPACVDATGQGDPLFCILPCVEETVCPDGMYCELGFGICAWDVIEPPPPPYGDCETMPVEDACAPTDICIDTPEGGICGGACEDATECPAAPDTGDAVVTCADLGAGNVCHLSCAMGETCPDGTECFNDQYCHFPAA